MATSAILLASIFIAVWLGLTYISGREPAPLRKADRGVLLTLLSLYLVMAACVLGWAGLVHVWWLTFRPSFPGALLVVLPDGYGFTMLGGVIGMYGIPYWTRDRLPRGKNTLDKLSWLYMVGFTFLLFVQTARHKLVFFPDHVEIVPLWGQQQNLSYKDLIAIDRCDYNVTCLGIKTDNANLNLVFRDGSRFHFEDGDVVVFHPVNPANGQLGSPFLKVSESASRVSEISGLKILMGERTAEGFGFSPLLSWGMAGFFALFAALLLAQRRRGRALRRALSAELPAEFSRHQVVAEIPKE